MECLNFWQYAPVNNTCVNRCDQGKSFNKYADDDNSTCIDIYDVWNELAESNEILQKNAEESRLGGPLTQML